MPDPSRADPRGGQGSGLDESEALRRLRRHEISLDEYLDTCVDQAVRHLVGVADAERLQFIRQLLRDQLMTDPVLIEYVREATGLDSRGASGK